MDTGDFGLLERRIGLSVIDKKNLKFIIFRYLFGSQKKRKNGANVSGALYYRSFWPLQTSLSPLRGTRNFRSVMKGRRSVAGPAEKLSLEVTAFCVLATHIHQENDTSLKTLKCPYLLV